MTVEEMKNKKKEMGLTYGQIAERSGVPLGTVQASPSARRMAFLSYPTDYDANNHAYYERYLLPAADGGVAGGVICGFALDK